MDSTKQNNDSDKQNGNLRNFDLTVDEIRLIKSIDEMSKSVENLERLEPQSSRAKIIRSEISKLQAQLEKLRENTLIKY